MNGSSVLRVGLGVCLLLGAESARAADAGAADAGTECRDSRDCAPPSPYCRSGQCVECLSDRNCTSSVCDVAAGTCRDCLSDADCGGSTPYCDGAHRCVECVSNANCRALGVECLAGTCGSCGDGICSAREGIYYEPAYGPFGPIEPATGRTACLADCEQKCPTLDVGSGLGEWSIPTAGLDDLFSSSCTPTNGTDATFQWKAEKTGNYLFEARGTAPGIDASTLGFVGVQYLVSGCATTPDTGVMCGSPSVVAVVNAGQTIVIAVDNADPAAKSLTLKVSDAGPCSGPFCPPSSGGDAGSGNDQGKSVCLAHARDRGEPSCSGIECACEHCPRDYDDTAVIPGARDILACMREKDCVGADCYNSGACRRVIDTNGGLSGAAFRASAGVASCALTFACSIPCASEGGIGDAGEGTDAGRLCAPGRVVSCSCDDGAIGEKTCNAAGSAFGACSCGGKTALKASSGCSCEVGRDGAESAGRVAASIGMLGVLLSRLRRRRSEGGRIR